MKRLCFLLVLAAACASDKYVHVEMSDGRSFYAERAEAERVRKDGMIDVKNVLTGKRLVVKRADCVIRSASRSEVTRAKGNYFVYDDK